MRTFHIWHIGSFMGLLLMMPFSLSAQQRNPFRALAEENRSQQIRRTLSASDTISLEGLETIYSLSIDATIHQPKEASLIRIILEDDKCNQYLVAESNWFINDTIDVTLDHYCEETAMLSGGLNPKRLIIYLSDGAQLTLHDIYVSSDDFGKGSCIEVKRNQAEVIVQKINQYNEKHCKLWRAGLTTNSLQSFHEREQIKCARNDISEDSYISNIIYYAQGIYEIGERQNNRTRTSSQYSPSFRWDKRHGRNWMTIPKNQWDSGWCVCFATCSVLEALMNLQYNDTLNLNLSEADIAFNNNKQPYKMGTQMYRGLWVAKNNGVIDEASYPFVPDSTQGWPAQRPEWNELIQISNYNSYYPSISGTEGLKNILINRGPCVSGYPGHAMALVGYDIVTEDDIYIVYNSSGRIEGTDYEDLLGEEFWIFKDNYFEHPDPYFPTIYGTHSGYQYIIFHDVTKFQSVCYVIGALTSQNYNSNDIVCKDMDGDGYFNWGIGPKPTHCPTWVPNEPDGDDSDATIGPMDEYGYCANISPDSTIYIDVNTEYPSGFLHISNNICIRNSSTLTLSCDLLMNRLAKIRIKPSSTLIVNGTIHNANIKPEPGSTLILNNGGRIITHRSDDFVLPTGAKLQINNGTIE